MNGQSRKHKVPVLAQATGRSGRSISVVLASLCLLCTSVGFVKADVADRIALAFPEPDGPHFSTAVPSEHNIELAAQLPKISTPQVHVNTGNVHPVTVTNSNALKVTGAGPQSSKIGNAHQFDKNNGTKGKGGNTKGAGNGAAANEQVQFNYNSIQRSYQ